MSTIQDAPAMPGHEPLQVFISWSGDRSRQVAEHLQVFIKSVMYSSKPWVSSKDIDAGSRWNNDILKALGEARFGILCLTPENLKSEWLHFEAGAIAKQLQNSERICPYRFTGVNVSDIGTPLSLFNAVAADRTGTHKMFTAINKALHVPVEQDTFERGFNAFWPEYEGALSKVADAKVPIPKPKTDPNQALEEILETVRNIERRIPQRPISVAGTIDSKLLENFVTLQDKTNWTLVPIGDSKPGPGGRSTLLTKINYVVGENSDD